MVEGRHLRDPEAFGGGDDGAVDGPEREIAVAGDQLGDPQPVSVRHGFDDRITGCQVTQKPDLGADPEPRADQVRHFRDDQRRNHQRLGVALQEFQGGPVVAVVGVDVGVQRSGVDEESYGDTSAASISLMRSEMSSRPLRPAPAACNRRGILD